MFEAIAPPGIALSILPGARNVRVQWSPYVPADAAGHQIIGYRLWRSDVPNLIGAQIADETVLIAGSTFFDDMSEPFQGETVFYTLAAVEPTDYGSRPYGEGGNVTFFGV